ncbi:MAG: sialate O-acetylesterase [Planctomycetaceae bacterium]
MRAPRLPLLAATLLAICAAGSPARADVALNNMFGDHMVLQQGIKNRVWGKADPGEEVTVTIAGQSHATKGSPDGRFEVFLDPLLTYGGPHVLTVKGKNTVTFHDVLVGEVWVCAGQSNMQWSVNASNDPDIERAAANFPQIRLISVPQVGTQEPQWNFDGRWQPCTPEAVGNFSAVGYFFGRQLHQTLGVPVGLINNAWGGSAAEAWVRRDKLAADARFKPLMERWEKMEAEYPAQKAAYDKAMVEWKAAAEKAKAEGKPAPGQPGNPDGAMRGNSRPANIHSGVLTPSIGYGIKGAIWYQGESNAGRAYQYRALFPLMIQSWRDEWGLGDFPFYWVQLADFKNEQPQPAESDWAELREAQTMTMKALPQTGEAVIIDIGEGKDIHPKNKQDVAKRLARWALAETYRVPGIACRSPLYKAMEKQGAKIVLAFDHVDGGWRPFDVPEPIGFTIAAADKTFVPAKATILPDGRIEVSADGVADPVAVRYAWADNPRCNMFSGVGLPLTPFRTDDFEGVTANAH